MDIQTKLLKIQQVGEEIVTIDELKTLLETKSQPIAYDGFEPSGKLHIAQGTMRAINVNKMISAGIKFKMLVADIFGWMNNKMGGDLEAIRKVGEYQIEVWKACGMKTSKIEFVWANNNMEDKEYWKRVIRIARESTVQRITRCAQIMGRTEKEALSAAQIFYPCMQCADIFHLKADITQLGMDQRKVNVLAREVASKINCKKPVVVSHHMLMGLKEPRVKDNSVESKIEMKMSKSMPESAIFMTDTEEEVEAKIKKAYCPEKKVEFNPLLEYYKFILFEKNKSIKFERAKKFGGDIEFDNYANLENAYVSGRLHPLDLKLTAAKSINKLLDPIRLHFKKNNKAKKLLDFVNSQAITR